MLEYKIDAAGFEALDEATRGFYKETNEGYRLEVTGTDDAKELKEALRKEREERAAAKKKLAEIEKEAQDAEAKRQQEKGEFEELWKKEQEKSTKTASELQTLRDKIANGLRERAALEVAATLTKDMKRADILKKESLPFIVHTDDGVKINGPDGDAWTPAQLGEHLSKTYPFLADGVQSSGGGASGGGGGGATSKTILRADFDALNPTERVKTIKDGTKVVDA